MTFELIGKVIGTYGFPIAMCLLLYWQNNTQMKELSKVVAANTEATNKLIDKLGAGV